MRRLRHLHAERRGAQMGHGMTATSEKKFSSNVDSLFGDMMADLKTSIKEDKARRAAPRRAAPARARPRADPRTPRRC
jgi:hypothetical protein